MTGRPAYRPHLWVPHGSENAEFCTVCGEFQTPENAAEACPETPDDMVAPLGGTLTDWLMLWNGTADMPEPPDGWDDEQRQEAALDRVPL
jgi:hypothetical protein